MKIYKSYGVLAHEKQPFYSAYAPASTVYDAIDLDIPVATATAADGATILVQTGEDWTPIEHALTNDRAGNPVIRWIDRYGHKHVIACVEK